VIIKISVVIKDFIVVLSFWLMWGNLLECFIFVVEVRYWWSLIEDYGVISGILFVNFGDVWC